MKKTIKILLFLLLIFNLLKGDIYAEKQNITWLVADFPPYSIVTGPYKGMGVLGYIRAKIEGSLKEYSHDTLIANSKRIFHELKFQDRVIYGTAAKTVDRAKHTLYSVPYIIILPNNLITLEKNAAKLTAYIDDSREFDLDSAVKERKISIGYSVARAYGRLIDKILKENSKSKMLKLNYRNFFRDSFVDLLNGNVDSIIGYPNEAEYFLKLLKREEKILTYPFKGELKYVVGYFVLPKTKWGEKTLKTLNKVLIENRNTEEFHQSYERWVDKRSRIIYRKLTEDLYSKNKEM